MHIYIYIYAHIIYGIICMYVYIYIYIINYTEVVAFINATQAPAGASGLLVVSAGFGGEMATGAAVPLVDFAPPDAVASLVFRGNRVS